MKIYCKNKHWSLNEDYNLDKILYLLIDRPNYFTEYNNFVWVNKINQHHRDYDLPAIVTEFGYIEWCNFYKTHRENNKPARILIDGQKEYWINDIFIKYKLKKKKNEILY